MSLEIPTIIFVIQTASANQSERSHRVCAWIGVLELHWAHITQVRKTKGRFVEPQLFSPCIRITSSHSCFRLHWPLGCKFLYSKDKTTGFEAFGPHLPSPHTKPSCNKNVLTDWDVPGSSGCSRNFSGGSPWTLTLPVTYAKSQSLCQLWAEQMFAFLYLRSWLLSGAIRE